MKVNIFRNNEKAHVEGGIGDPGKQRILKFKRVQGHAEVEDLCKMKRCLVGKTTTVCNDLQWSYLKEIFEDVFPWSESMVQLKSATWLELSEIPLHCWNQCTFKRVAELWGMFEALGETVFHSKDCEKMTILITTRQAMKIDEVVDVEVGDMLYEVKVVEIGFSDNSLELQAVGVKVSGSEVEESSSEPSDADVRRKSRSIRSSERAVENLSHMGFPPDVEDVHLNIKLNPKDSFVPTKERERLSLRSSEEVQDLGMNSLWEDVESGSRKTKDPCAKAIDEKFNEGFSNVFGDNVSGSLLENYSDGESSRAFFSEMEPIRLNKRGIKGKRYSSLDLQDKKITATKRKKRDKAMRRQKLDKKNPDWSELSGRSLSDSDLLARRDIQIKR
ncbi:hypothetical protein V6N13_029138 [Hibiscus sabdariffa]